LKELQFRFRNKFPLFTRDYPKHFYQCPHVHVCIIQMRLLIGFKFKKFVKLLIQSILSKYCYNPKLRNGRVQSIPPLKFMQSKANILEINNHKSNTVKQINNKVTFFVMIEKHGEKMVSHGLGELLSKQIVSKL